MARKRKREQANPKITEKYGIRANQGPSGATLSPADVGEMLGVTGGRVTQWITQKRLPAVKLSRYWRIDIEDVLQFAQQRRKKRTPSVLLVGVNAQTLKARAKQLQSSAYKVLIGQGMAETLLQVLDFSPALIVIDLTDFEEGWELAKRFRSSKKLRSVSILFISNTTLKDDEISRALTLKIQGCLTHAAANKTLKDEVERRLAFAV